MNNTISSEADHALAKLKEQVGQEMGVSNWVTVTQDMIDMFSKATLDPDPMHTDPEWCDENSPFKVPVAFGFMTISLLMHLLHDVVGFQSQSANGREDMARYGLNYGFDRLRLMSPVPVNSRVRGHFKMIGLTERRPGEYLQKISATIEIEGKDKPALVAEWLSVVITDEGHQRVAQYSSAS